MNLDGHALDNRCYLKKDFMNSILKISILSLCISASIQASEKLSQPTPSVDQATITKNIHKPPSKSFTKKPAPVIKYFTDKIRKGSNYDLDDPNCDRDEESVEEPVTWYEKECAFWYCIKCMSSQRDQKTNLEEGH